MKHITKCKFCQKEITLDIDDNYAALGDPFKLITLAACNRCADLRTRRMAITDKIAAVCYTVAFAPASIRSETKEKMKPVLRGYLMAYVGLVEDWKGGDSGEFDESVVEAVLSAPGQWPDVIKRLWDIVRPSQQGAFL
jgi:hypothetical protein